MTTPTLASPDLDSEALGQLLLLILNSIVGTFEQAGVALPERRYVHYGLAAADCTQLSVSLGQLYVGLPGDDPNQTQKCDGPRSANVVITLFRAVPVASGPRGQDAPTPTALTESALGFARDAWLLLDAVHMVDTQGWKKGAIAEVSPIDPSGGFAGVQATLTVQVP